MLVDRTKRSKIRSQLSSELRVKLQRIARELLDEVAKAKAEPLSDTARGHLQGRLEGYLLSRHALLPDVSADGYMRELEGAVSWLKREGVV